MLPSRRTKRNRAKPSVGLQERRIGQQQKRDEQWNARFKELLDYRSEHGDCDVPNRQGKLGKWVSKQRTAYTTDSLAQDRIDRLSSIGFRWTLGRRYDEQWKARFKELLDYRSEHGDCNVPQGQGKLGEWVHHQRTAYAAGSLEQERIDRLNGIGFKWALKEAAPIVPWETRFNELVQYKAKHGNYVFPRRQGSLGTWVLHQRQQYKKGKLSKDRIDRLNSIDFDWAPPNGGAPWATRLGELVEYKAKNGDCCIPQRRGKLGKWVDGQRQQYKKGKLSQDRIDLLESIGFDWTPIRGRRKRKAPDGTESDDDVDEIGALIYDQVMRQRRPTQFYGPEGVPIKTEEIETEDETDTDLLFKSEDALSRQKKR